MIKEKSGIITGKFELIPITRDIGIDSVKKTIPDVCISQDMKNEIDGLLSEYEIVFFVFNTDSCSLWERIICKNNSINCNVVEIIISKNNELSNKDFCSIMYYASQWLLKYAKKERVLIYNDSFDKDIIRRLRLLEFKKSKLDGYYERTAPDLDPMPAIISILNGL